jgi:16S rRNA (cytosine1402-N4)-methyltransferase
LSDPSSAEPPRPPRRKRYSGRNPRRFEDKYKERNPEKYPETIAKVLASGKTPAGAHVPILVNESLEALRLAPGMIGIDGTLGHGGHAHEILKRIVPGGKLHGLDIDPIEQPRTESRLRDLGFGPDVFEAVRSNYAGISKLLSDRGLEAVDFIYADLGCSSMQLDDPSRGFSFKVPGPLDMRMNPQRGLSAAEWLERVKPEKLRLALEENADEPRAGFLADALAGKRYAATSDLVHAIRSVLPNISEETVDLTIRRVFQAVRIAVNEEFTALDSFLRALPACLKAGARVAILTFHSGEDRRVKKAFQAGLRNGDYAAIAEDVIIAGPEERRNNPRSASAKLRWAEKSK